MKKAEKMTSPVSGLAAPERRAAEHSEAARSGGAAKPDTGEFKLRVLREADRCTEPGSIGALLRRHGLYSSLLTTWRRERDEGALRQLGRKRGRKSTRNPLADRVAELERENRRLQNRLRQAETIIDVQKKVAEILGIPLNSPPIAGVD